MTERILIFQVASPLLYQTQTRNTPIVVSGGSLPHSCRVGNDIAAFLLPTRSCLSRFLPSPLVRVGRKRRRWRLITTQSPLPVRPTPTRSEKGSNRLLPPRAIHYRRVPLHSKTNNLHPRVRGKKSPSLSLSLHHPPSSPPLFSKSPEGRPIALHYWHPGNPLRENGADSTLRTDRRTHRANLRIINGPGSFEHDIGRNADRPRPDYHPRYNSSIEFPISGDII